MNPYSRPRFSTNAILAILIVTAVLLLAVYLFDIGYIETSNGPPLSSFAIEPLEISSSQNDSVVISGLVYVAETHADQVQGFQNAKSFGNCNGLSVKESKDCIGMIFVTNSSSNLCFWMHDTLIPLLQVWISSSGKVTNTYDASPENDNSVCHVAMDVLETNQNFRVSVNDSVLIG